MDSLTRDFNATPEERRAAELRANPPTLPELTDLGFEAEYNGWSRRHVRATIRHAYYSGSIPSMIALEAMAERGPCDAEV